MIVYMMDSIKCIENESKEPPKLEYQLAAIKQQKTPPTITHTIEDPTSILPNRKTL